ncbi:MAG: glycoside hydrolase family 15 protein [Proteobacteria bacterium]|nr:glycoside hydrolase family 15 protein [Pseudomonadota bacterium]
MKRPSARRFVPVRSAARPYPPISDYALIGDCHSAALISRAGSIDWCCLPRFDSDSCFGRLLDWQHGGHFSITPQGKAAVHRQYLDDTLVLVTTYRSGRNIARVTDFFSMRMGGRSQPRRELVRIIEGVRGKMSFDVAVVPRLDFGEVKPWIFSGGRNAHFAVGSNTGIRIFGDVAMEIVDAHDLHAEVAVRARTKLHIGLQFLLPEDANATGQRRKPAQLLRAHLKETVRWWRKWSDKIVYDHRPGVNIVRSAITLKALTYAPTGAIVAAPTTSLPERKGGERNWDYRYCWIRDSIFTVWALNAVGAVSEAEGVRHFIQRASAGNAADLQVLYGVDGKRRLPEIELTHLDGWRGSRPVRIGNGAAHQYQADMYGLLVEFAWQWSQLRHRPTPAYWKFLAEVIEAAIARWRLPDRGIWEVRSRPLHFVHSKVMCWAAANRGVALAEKYGLPAPLKQWREARDAMRAAIEKRGVDHARGIYVRSFGSKDVDAALLLLPMTGFVAYDDERMVRTVEVISQELMQDGLLLRYQRTDGLAGAEGVFLACTFWLVSCLAHAGRKQQASRIFKRAVATGNDLGLFAEEYSRQGREMLGNFPQGLTHLSHIGAALALMNVRQPQI